MDYVHVIHYVVITCTARNALRAWARNGFYYVHVIGPLRYVWHVMHYVHVIEPITCTKLFQKSESQLKACKLKTGRNVTKPLQNRFKTGRTVIKPLQNEIVRDSASQNEIQ